MTSPPTRAGERSPGDVERELREKRETGDEQTHRAFLEYEAWTAAEELSLDEKQRAASPSVAQSVTEARHEGKHARRVVRRAVRGLLAGTLGSAALFASDAVERRMLGRRPAYAPGKVAARRSSSPQRPPGTSGALLRLGYGALLGLAYSMLPERLRQSTLAAGLVFGGSVAAAEFVALPATGATPRPGSWSMAERLLLPVHSAMFGVTLAAAHTYLDREPSQRNEWPVSQRTGS